MRKGVDIRLLLLHLCLLLVALDDDIWPVAPNEDLGWHPGIQLSPVLFDLLSVVTCLVVWQDRGLVGRTFSSRKLATLHLTHHGVREAVWSDAEHPVAPISHGHGAVASLAEGGLRVGLAAAEHVVGIHLLLLADRVGAHARVLLVYGILLALGSVVAAQAAYTGELALPALTV